MKKIPRFLSRIFSPKYMQELDVLDLLNALNDPGTRKIWLFEVYQELRQLNLGVERALFSGQSRINDLSARRKAFADVLEMVQNAKRRRLEEKDPNPRFQAEVDLDRVTV